MNSFQHIKYKPSIPWSKYDFQINKVYWEIEGLENAHLIRLHNLKDLCEVMKECGLEHWLFGKTLAGAIAMKTLMPDHDDDIGVYVESRGLLLNAVSKKLVALGFNLIRETKEIVSFERNFRYIDICLFSKRGFNYIGYGNKLIKSRHLSVLKVIEIDKMQFYIPDDADALVRELYEPRLTRIFLNMFRRLFDSSSVSVKVLNLFKRIRGKFIFIIENSGSRYPMLHRCLAPFFQISTGRLSLNEFKDLSIEPAESFNWAWRYMHLSPVTKNCQLSKVNDIIEYLSKLDVRSSIEKSTIETDMTIKFHAESNFDYRFWWGGNNFFWYCVKYMYRDGVIPYSLANAYISKSKGVDLYSSRYFESLPEMTDSEIEKFLSLNPIVIQNGCIISGKHRVFAMIGRLASGRSYIPFSAIVV